MVIFLVKELKLVRKLKAATSGVGNFVEYRVVEIARPVRELKDAPRQRSTSRARGCRGISPSEGTESLLDARHINLRYYIAEASILLRELKAQKTESTICCRGIYPTEGTERNGPFVGYSSLAKLQ